jgi:hypothetical protein
MVNSYSISLTRDAQSLDMAGACARSSDLARCQWDLPSHVSQVLSRHADGWLHDVPRVTLPAPPIFFLDMEYDICRELDMHMRNGLNAPVISPIAHMYDMRDASGVCTDSNADCQ